MDDAQRQRAGLAVRVQMNERGLTVVKLAEEAGVAEGTIRALLSGERWPRPASRVQIARALGWPDGEIRRRASRQAQLESFTVDELLSEISRRFRALEEPTST